MASSTPNTILVKVNSTSEFYRATEELIADDVLTPGHVVNIDSDGEATTFDGSAAAWSRLLVVESEYGLEGTTKNIDQTYAVGARANCVFVLAGDKGYCLISDGETVVKGSALVPGTGGELIVRTSEALGTVCAYAEEAVSPSGSAGRCHVRFI